VRVCVCVCVCVYGGGGDKTDRKVEIKIEAVCINEFYIPTCTTSYDTLKAVLLMKRCDRPP
jgi:hypothetical protein